jgi:hypothetical protein
LAQLLDGIGVLGLLGRTTLPAASLLEASTEILCGHGES